MAWLDFMKAVRQSNEDEKKRKGVAGTFLNAIDNTLDAGEAVGRFAGNVAQSIPRGAVSSYLSLKEAGRNNDLDQRNRTIDEILNVPEADRERILKDDNDPRSVTLRQAKKNLGGDLSDKALVARKKSNTDERKGHVDRVKAENPVARFLIGGEEDEVAQSSQTTAEHATRGLEKRGVNQSTAGFLGSLAGIGAATLDAPTGISNVAKGVGTKGIRALVEEGSEDGIRNIIKSRLPKISDNMLSEIAPRLAAATDEKSVKEILTGAGRSTINPVAAPISAAKNFAKQSVEDLKTITPGLKSTEQTLKTNRAAVDDVIDDTADTVTDAMKDVPQLSNGRRPSGYGDDADELLGRLRSSTDLKDPSKPGFRTQVKEQFVDKLSPVNDLVKMVEEKTGKKLDTEDNPYQLMRLYNGMPDKVQARISGLSDILKQAPDLDAVRLIGTGQQMLDRSRRGISNTISDDKVRGAIQGVYKNLGAEKYNRAAEVVDAVNDYNKSLLDDLHEAGIISDDSFRAITEVGANYFAKFNVIDHIMKNDQNRALFASSGSYNTTKQSLNKILSNAKGMEEGTEILDPIESIVRSTDQTMRAIAKNEIWHSFNRLADQVPDMIQRARDPEDVLKRIDLSLENQELRPIRDGLDRMMKTSGRQVRRLQTQVNQLERRGLQASLKNGGERMNPTDFLVEGLGGKLPTSQTGRQAPSTSTGDLVSEFVDVARAGTTRAGGTLPDQKLGPSDTVAFLRNLIEKGSRSEIDRIKKMVGTRDEKMTALLDEIGTMKSQYDDVAGKIRSNVDQARDLADDVAPDGYAMISGFGQGVQGKLAVPKEIADIFTGKNAAQQDYLTSLISNVNGFVKQNFTSNNPAFALVTNPIRDAKSFAYNAQDVRSNPVSIGLALADGLMTRVFKRGDIYDRWVQAGGRSGFYADERDAANLVKDTTLEITGRRKVTSLGVKTLPVHNAKDFVREATRVLTAPLRTGRDALQGAAGILEDAPRVAQFKASVKAGKTDAQAAFNSRNVTVDFQQSGRIGQTVNAWVPFLNARLQGTLKSAEAVKRNPARAAAVYASLTAAPILLAAANNQRFPEVMKMIPDSDRDNNFVIVLGDDKDEVTGKYNQVIKIPKSDIDKILGNPLEQVARYMADDDPDSLAGILTNMVGSVLPIDTVRDDQFSLERTVGSLLPPPLKAPVEAVTNRSLYFGAPIVPESMQDLPNNEQVREDDPTTVEKESSTNPIDKFLGNLVGASPLKTANTRRNFTGNLLENPAEQLGGKLAGASDSKMNNEFYKTLNRTSKIRASTNNQVNEALARGDYASAQQVVTTYNNYLAREFKPFVDTYRKQLTPEMVDTYEEQKMALTSRSIKQRQRNILERQATQ